MLHKLQKIFAPSRITIMASCGLFNYLADQYEWSPSITRRRYDGESSLSENQRERILPACQTKSSSG
jgi:hypothetical protein